MRLQRRQYVLIAAIIVIGCINFWRLRNAPHQQPLPPPPPAPTTPGTSPAWGSFDSAAAVKDAPDAQFQPALQALTRGIGNSDTELADLDGCKTWLLFYRDEHLHPTNKSGWLAQTQHHVDSCVARHRDIAP